MPNTRFDLSRHGMRKVLVSLAILTLPFTLALTINLRFPLKIYEVALLGAGLACLVDFRIPTLRSARSAVLPVIAVVGFASAVLLLHLWLPPEGLSTSGFASRFGPFGDGIAKLLYLLLAVFGFLLIAERTYQDEQLVLRCWLIGAKADAGMSSFTPPYFASRMIFTNPSVSPEVRARPLAENGKRPTL